MTVRVETSNCGRHIIVAGDHPFQVAVSVRPVGTLEVCQPTLDLLKGPFAPEYIPDLIDALREAHRIALRDKPWEPVS